MSENCDYKDEKEKLTMTDTFIGMLVGWIQTIILFAVDNSGISKVLGYFGLQLRSVCGDSQPDHKRKHDLVEQSSDEEAIQQVKMETKKLRADEVEDLEVLNDDHQAQDVLQNKKEKEATEPIHWNSSPDLNFMASSTSDPSDPVNPFSMVKDVLAKHYNVNGGVLESEEADHQERYNKDDQENGDEEEEEWEEREEEMFEYQEEIEKAENVEKVENDEEENDGDGVVYDEEDEEEKEETKTEESEFKNENGDPKEEKNDLEGRENMNSREGKGVEDPREGVEELGKAKENVAPLAPLEGKENEDSKEIGMVGKDSRYGKDENSNDSPSKIQSQNVIPPTTSRTSPIKWLRSMLRADNNTDHLNLPNPPERKTSECMDASEMIVGAEE